MSTFQRAILFSLGLFLVIISTPQVFSRNIYSSVDQSMAVFSLIFGSIVALYNFLIIYKKATTIQVVVDSDTIRKSIRKQEGEDNYG